uniref:Protein RETICULATA-RELATED 1, chloroplastic n=2 Tax=Elaeis guineensis var. tenera TaxID=51953 RepID=A0A6J0PM60_ELAGV|nr:protein RETICULATA-RELATED 1, chloroplastic [Elaeis guineensis]
MPGDVEPGQWDALERCFAASPDSDPPSCSSSSSSLLVSGVMAPVMKGQYGAFGAVTLEKSKLDLSQKTTQSSAETATGGGGGDIGKKNFHGGGDGGDDGGDDDDYFDDFDEDDEGDEGGLFRRRLVLQELFDRKFVDAVLQEWYKTMINLPAGLRQAYEMGLVSSAQMVRFLSINARPTTSRFISRALPQSLSRAFIGRMLADPSFLYKLILEQAATIGCAVWWELKNRKERIKQEWDLALINVLTASACNAFIVWSLAPCRSYGNTFRFDLQNTIQKLPNNVFEKSYPLREFDLQKRIQSFFLYKVPELCLVGVIAGSLQGILLKVSSAKKEGRLSVTIPSVSTYALGYGSFLGLYANLRYQLLCGIDRFMFDRFDVLGVPIFFSTALRILNVQIGEISRHAWLGVEADPLLQSDNLLKAYNRPSEATNSPSSKWFISKNTIISGLGLLGIKQGSGEPEAKPSKTRRKRIVRKKARTA